MNNCRRMADKPPLVSWDALISIFGRKIYNNNKLDFFGIKLLKALCMYALIHTHTYKAI